MPDNEVRELFIFYRDGHFLHVHTERSVFERWMTESRWLYPPDRCEIVRFVPSVPQPTPLGFWS